MTEDNLQTLHSILEKTLQEKQRLRFYGHPMNILAEGFICDVGQDFVAIAHKEDNEPDEYLHTDAIIKLQKLGEYSHF